MKFRLPTLLLASSLRPRLVHGLVTASFLRLERFQNSLASCQPDKLSTSRAMSSTSTNVASETTPAVHRILCYGDSLTAGTSTWPLELYPYAPHLEQALNSQTTDSSKTYVVRHRGMPGWTADAMVDAADDGQYGLRSAIRGIQNPSLSCVLILAGTNDLGYAAGAPKEEQVSTIVTPVQALHEMAWSEGVPRTIAIAVPPSGYQANVKEAADLAQQVNQALEAFCQSSGGKGVFVPFPFDYERDGDNWSPDSLHFSPNGYEVLGKYMADPVSQVLNDLDA